jgi:hypothetical protein
MKVLPKILFSVLIIALSFVLYRFIPTESNEPTGDGTVHLIVIDELGNEYIDSDLDFNSGDTLFDVLDENYELTCLGSDNLADDTCSYESQFGYAILGIGDVKTTWTSSYLQIFINEESSNYGAAKMVLNDQDEIKVVWVDLS